MVNLQQLIADTAHESTALLLSSLEEKSESDSLESITSKVLLSHSSRLLKRYHDALKSELARQGIDV